MASLITRIRNVIKTYPITRGILTYSILYPSSNCTQQLLDPQREKVDPLEIVRFGFFGTFIVAPTFYGWVKLASIIVVGNKLKHCIIKAYVEQFIWAPFAYTQFYMGITALEGRPWEECVHELKTKFIPTWKIGFCVWPFIQTANFWIIPEKNRVPFVAFCSFLWNIFLSYMHHRDWTRQTKNKDVEYET